MRRLTLLAATLALATLTVGIISPAAQTAPDTYEACGPARETISAPALPETVEVEKCPVGERVITDNGIGTALPDPGESIYVDALTTEGSQELEVTHYRNGTLELEHVGDESGSEAEVGAAASGPGECRDTARTNLNHRVDSILSWKFNRGTTPRELTQKAALRALKAGGANITNTRNSCHMGDRVPQEAGLSYAGKTSLHAEITANAHCVSGDGMTVVSFGELPRGVLAVACFPSSGTVRASDVKFNKTHFNWTTRPGSRSCNKEYDLASVMTHERGHTFGLGHVSEDSHGNLTMSQRINGTCQSSERTLGRGDVLGLDDKYPG